MITSIHAMSSACYVMLFLFPVTEKGKKKRKKALYYCTKLEADESWRDSIWCLTFQPILHNASPGTFGDFLLAFSVGFWNNSIWAPFNNYLIIFVAKIHRPKEKNVLVGTHTAVTAWLHPSCHTRLSMWRHGNTFSHPILTNSDALVVLDFTTPVTLFSQ